MLILGTPAEEGGGGKVFLAERGALDGVDAAMMVHPAGADLTAMNAIAIQQLHAHVLRARRPTPPRSRTRAATPSTPRCSAT